MSKPNLKLSTFSCVIQPPAVLYFDGLGGSGDSGGGTTGYYYTANTGDSLDWGGTNQHAIGDAGGIAALDFNAYAVQLAWDVPGSIGKPYDDGSGNIDWVGFAQWAKAHNYAIGHAIITNDVVAFDVVTVLQKSSPGGWRQVGTPTVTQQATDTAFGIAVGLAASAVGAGWAMALGSSFTAGNYKSIAIQAFEAYATGGASDSAQSAAAASDAGGGSISAATGGTMDNFDLGDAGYGDFFSGYDFSSGESAIAFGDAENVDFGFNTADVLQQDPSQVTGLASGMPDDTTGELDGALMHNATPEVTTNDFGTTFSDNGTANGDSTVAPAPVTGVPLSAVAPAASLAAKFGSQTPAAGSTLAKGSVGSAPDAGASLGNLFSPLVSAAAALSSTAGQMTTAQPRSFFGQLSAGGATTPGGIDTNTLLICGAALVALALLIHFEG